MKPSVLLILILFVASISLTSRAEIDFIPVKSNTRPRHEYSMIGATDDVPSGRAVKVSATYAWDGGEMRHAVIAHGLRQMQNEPSWNVNVQYAIIPGPESELLRTDLFNPDAPPKPRQNIQFSVSGTPVNVRDALVRLRNFWSFEHKIVRDQSLILEMTLDIEKLTRLSSIGSCGLF